MPLARVVGQLSTPSLATSVVGGGVRVLMGDPGLGAPWHGTECFADAKALIPR